MKSRHRLMLWGALSLLLLLVIGAFVLPRLVDAESYRGLLRSSLQRQLGRDVEFGAMELSLWPVLGVRLDDLTIGRTPSERFDKPVVAESLRVGARLFPLLRGRLDVTSLIVEGPVVTLFERGDGAWEPVIEPPGDPRTPAVDPAQASVEGAPLVIEKLKVTRGRVVLRREVGGALRESTIDDVTLDLSGLGTSGPIVADLSARLGASARIRGDGTFRPADASSSGRLSGRVEIEEMDPATLREWLAALVPTLEFPDDLLAERSFSSSATVDYSATQPARLVLSDATVQGLGLRLVRSASGAWNIESLGVADDGASQTEESAGMAIQLSNLTVEKASVRIEDRSARGDPATFELSPLRLTLRQPQAEASIEIELDARGGVAGKAGLKGRATYDPATASTVPRVRGTLEVTGIDPRDLRLANALASLPAGLVVGRSFGVSAEIDAMFADTPDVKLRNVSLRDLDLAVERNPAGAWSFAQSTPAKGPPVKASPTPGISPPSFHAERIELSNASLQLTDRTAAGQGGVLKLNALRLALDRLPTAGPAVLELDAQAGSGSGGKLAVRGKLGPLGADPAAMPLDLTLLLKPVAVADLGFLVPTTENLDVAKATAAANLRLSGAFVSKIQISGETSLSKATVAFARPRGDVANLPFDLVARGDVGVSRSGTRIDLSRLDLELPRDRANRTLTLRGSVDASSDPPRVDIELLPTSVAADDLAALAALFASGAPLSFASPDPVALQLRARGPFGGESLPELEGKATLSGFRFLVAGMAQPMEQVGAEVTFSGREVTLEALGGVIGKSDVTGSRVVITDFTAPRIQLDLNSRNADFWELFSFIESAPATADPASKPDPDDLLSRITIQGTLRIDKGSLQTLTFEEMKTGMNFREGVLTLEPLEMKLYGGSFAGKVVQNLNTGVLTIDGDGTGVDADGFLAQNLELGGLISGRASTKQSLQVRAADPANVLAGVSGGGPLEIVDGRLAKLDVLKSLSKVTGIFGERSLQRLTKQLATADTPFRRAQTRLRFDSGTLTFEDVVIETAELSLAGPASLEAASGKLEGQFVAAFSPELSATMREEQSRAASVFWDPKTQRVVFGFGVKGSATSPSVSVDWDSALRGLATRGLESALQGLLGRKPGSGPPVPPGGTSPPSEATPPVEGTPKVAGDEPIPGPPLTASGLIVEIVATRWTGPLLARDLTLEGNVRGAGIERASLSVVDARGTEVQRIDRLRPVDDRLGTVTDQAAELTIPWSARIDGKRLLIARFPVKVTVTVYDRQGRSASAGREVVR